MSLHTKDKDLLIKLQNYLVPSQPLLGGGWGGGWLGNIIKHGPASVQYRISSIKDMLVLISHCNNFPLTSKKRIDF